MSEMIFVVGDQAELALQQRTAVSKTESIELVSCPHRRHAFRRRVLQVLCLVRSVSSLSMSISAILCVFPVVARYQSLFQISYIRGLFPEEEFSTKKLSTLESVTGLFSTDSPDVMRRCCRCQICRFRFLYRADLRVADSSTGSNAEQRTL